jgi:low molecular weight phosphotyrosine protein phosphatase
MDSSNLQDVKRIQPKNSRAIVQLFGEYSPDKSSIIEDPYYGGVEGFKKNYEQATSFSNGFLVSLGFNSECKSNKID